jgi:rod shape-determining protein MreC
VLLDKGASDGVFKGQAVLDAEGIFGQVWRVNAQTSEVILISDAEHAIPVQSNRSGLRTIAVGTGDPDSLSPPFRPSNRT